MSSTKFQSTPPVRGATPRHRSHHPKVEVSIHAPRAGSDKMGKAFRSAEQVSIHAPRAGSDEVSCEVDQGAEVSIHAPRAGSDQAQHHRERRRHVSIHAPRAGSDPARQALGRGAGGFNPRPPCGERQVPTTAAIQSRLFQSTPPVRGATGDARVLSARRGVSIHAPRAGSDCTTVTAYAARENWPTCANVTSQ